MRPLYIHDCKDCIFLGSYDNKDLYFCEWGNLQRKTVIVRSSSKPADYISGLCFSDVNKHLKEAKRLAKIRKLLN